MEKARNVSLWVEEGYKLFAEEGMDGLQVERLARITQLNKSGFYHYFGDLEGFCEELIRKHEKIAVDWLADVREIKTIDPDFLQLLVEYKTAIMFQVHLIRCKNNPLFHKTAEGVDQREEIILRPLWSDYIGFQDNPDLALKYYEIVRDMLYTRISLQNLNYPFLHNSMSQARELMQQIARQSALETNGTLL